MTDVVNGLKKAQVLTSELYGILNDLTEDMRARTGHGAGTRSCKSCGIHGHRSDACPNKTRSIVPESKKLSELEFDDVQEKFEELGTSKKVAEELGLPMREVNFAVEVKDFQAYLAHRKRYL